MKTLEQLIKEFNKLQNTKVSNESDKKQYEIYSQQLITLDNLNTEWTNAYFGFKDSLEKNQEIARQKLAEKEYEQNKILVTNKYQQCLKDITKGIVGHCPIAYLAHGLWETYQRSSTELRTLYRPIYEEYLKVHDEESLSTFFCWICKYRYKEALLDASTYGEYYNAIENWFEVRKQFMNNYFNHPLVKAIDKKHRAEYDDDDECLSGWDNYDD